VLDAETITDPDALGPMHAEWDELAVACALPLMAPAWVMAWWRHQAPEGSQLRIVAAHDGERLTGLAPFYVAPRQRGKPVTYRLLAADFSTSVSPLARPERAWEAAEAIGGALADATPRPDLLDLAPMPLASLWHVALRARWPGVIRPLSYRYDLQSSPVVSLHDESFDAWFAARSGKFRTSMRRLERLFEAEGGTMRLSTPDTLAADLESFARLHAMRWEGRSASRLTALGQHLTATLLDAGHALFASERAQAIRPGSRFRLRIMEVDGEAICADLTIAAGGEIVGFNMGWNERFKRMSPTLLAFLYKIRDGFLYGDRRVQLGWGGHMYKLRFANGDAPVTWSLLLPPGRRLPIAFAYTAPLVSSAWIRDKGKRALTPAQIDRLRPLARLMPR
jgi:CelD/BcsL family acetyltransferase involved in cellulose biosynthesis